MKKTIKILGILAAALLALAALGVGVCILLQRPLGEFVFGFPESAMGRFAFPLSTVVYSLGLLFCAGLLCLVAGNGKLGIWSDILLLAVMNVLPLLQSLLAWVETVIAGKFGHVALSVNSMVQSMCSYPLQLGGWGLRLALVVGGMSIVWKLMRKQEA